MELLKSNFVKCVKGYHLINTVPINQIIWEDINAIILKASGVNIQRLSNGSHLSGADIDCDIGKFSNKSTKYKKKDNICISSYRLTTICNSIKHGSPDEIIKGINKRCNFTDYSILVRNEYKDYITYEWYIIPCDHPAFNPDMYEWTPTLGQRGNNKNKQIGWQTNTIEGSFMKISYSMSSQLWITVSTNSIKNYLVERVKIKNIKKYDYIDIYNTLCD